MTTPTQQQMETALAAKYETLRKPCPCRTGEEPCLPCIYKPARLLSEHPKNCGYCPGDGHVPHVTLEGVLEAAGNGGKHHVELSNGVDGEWHFQIYDDTNLRVGSAMETTPLAAAVSALFQASQGER